MNLTCYRGTEMYSRNGVFALVAGEMLIMGQSRTPGFITKMKQLERFQKLSCIISYMNKSVTRSSG